MGLFDAFKKNKNPEPAQAASQTAAPAPVDLTKKVNLMKEEVKKVILTKPVLNGLKAKVALVLDFSGSMDRLYSNGEVQRVVERTLPLAMAFDDDGSMETWIFDNGFHRLPDVTMSNLEGYVLRETTQYRMGGTYYAPVMRDVVETYKGSNLPAYVLFITDGNNSDKAETDKIIIEASKKPIFWQFVGIGGASFNYLEQLDDMSGRYVDNADFFAVSGMDSITYNKLLDEFPGWLQNDKVKKMLG